MDGWGRDRRGIAFDGWYEEEVIGADVGDFAVRELRSVSCNWNGV